MRLRSFLTVRQSATLSVAALALEAVVSGLSRHAPRTEPLLARLPVLHAASEAAGLSVLVGLALLGLAPRLWRGTRTAVSVSAAGLLALAALNAAAGRSGEASIEACLALLLMLGRGAFPLGCSNRPRLAIVCAAVGAWGLAWCAVRLTPLVHASAGRSVAGALRHSVAHALRAAVSVSRPSGDWTTAIEALIGCAALISVLAVRSLLRPARAVNGHAEHEDAAARAIVARHGDDSLSPFLVRPDKALAFAAGGVLSYRVIGGTAVVSADPVAPDADAGAVVESFLAQARGRGWDVVLWAVSDRHVDAYRRMGLRAVCAGEEAVVDPRAFTLDGRRVRKLRQSVHRVARRGWEISALDGRDVDAALEAEIDAVERAWRRERSRLHGFAMGMGPFPSPLGPDDLCVLARSPSGGLGAVMRFAAHCGRLSLDTMHRVGDTPNGLNEALVARGLEVARRRGVDEVSLNYAGLGHLVRREPSRSRLARAVTRLALAPLQRRFQMERLVRFNDKFAPQWRPRYLVYQSRGGLPRAVLRVLQAEGYLPERRLVLPGTRGALRRAVPARPRPRAPASEPR
jgi:lysyl-tRNA synthetase class 2